MIRAFVALELPDEVRARLALLQYLLPLPQRTEPEEMHLTLAFLGEVPDVTLEAAHEALAALRLPEFEVRLQGVAMFGGAQPRLVYVGVAPNAGLMRLQAKVETSVRQAGVPMVARRFVPHVTLGRLLRPGPAEVMPLERAVVAEAGFYAGPFKVDCFTLFASHPGRKGARYECLMRYRLGGGLH